MKANPKTALVSILIVLAALLGSWLLLRTAPTPGTKEKTRAPKIVQVTDLATGSFPISITAYGTVVPARQLVVRPQVSGQILTQHPALIQGGRIAKGETLFTLDDADYKIALQEAWATLAGAETGVTLESGRQNIARREFEQLKKDLPGTDINKALVLREPFQLQADALVQAARAAVERAELEVARCRITAPFDAIVLQENVEIGQLADSGSELATLVGSDSFWVRANVPPSNLSLIKIPGAQATVELAGTGGQTTAWQGTTVRVLGDIEEAGRLARVLVQVFQPLDTFPENPLLLGSYVSAKIDAGTIQDAVRIPRAALREGDQLWLVGQDNKLRIRDTTVLWKEDSTVLVTSPATPGESLIVSDLRSPVPGMELDPQPAP